jgi:alanyl-tRNA synthetase
MEAEATAELQKRRILPTEDKAKYTWHQDHPANVKAIFSAAGFLDTTSEHDVGVVLDSTSFYAEQGGQVSSQVLNLSWQKDIICVIWKVLLIGWE